MLVVSILNPKGGSGKTTLATNLSRALKHLDIDVLLVDADPQGSARDWSAANEKNPVPLIALDRPNNLKNLSSVVTNNYGMVIVDGAGSLAEIIPAAIRVSDVVLIPTQPSPYDVWATSDLVELIKASREVADRPKAAFVLTRMIKNTKLGREVVDALREYELPIFESFTVQRQVYPQTASEGLTPVDLNPDSVAGLEMVSIARELLTFIEGT